jgi:hypothetical protein
MDPFGTISRREASETIYPRPFATSVARVAQLMAFRHSDRCLTEFDAELEQFAVDARRARERVGRAHAADQVPNFGIR